MVPLLCRSSLPGRYLYNDFEEISKKSKWKMAMTSVHHMLFFLSLTTTLQIYFDFCIPRRGTARPLSQFPHSCVCERFIYSHDRSTYFPAAEYADGSWEYIIAHRNMRVGTGTVVPFLGIYVSNFRYSIFAVQGSCSSNLLKGTFCFCQKCEFFLVSNSII
jgi:hypothetical protein